MFHYAGQSVLAVPYDLVQRYGGLTSAHIWRLSFGGNEFEVQRLAAGGCDLDEDGCRLIVTAGELDDPGVGRHVTVLSISVLSTKP